MGSGNKPQSTTTSNVTPWGPAQPYLQDAMKGASDWLKDPNSSATFQGSTVIPFSNQTLYGMDDQSRFAQGAGQAMQHQANKVLYNGGYNQRQLNAMDTFQRAKDGGMSQDTWRFQNTWGDLDKMASGKYLGKGNPHMMAALGIANENAMTGVGDAMSAAGRYGSGTMQSTLAKTIADSNTNALANQYNQDVSNMLNASNMQMGAAQNIANIGAANAERKIGAASNLFNAGQQGTGNMAAAYQAGLMPGTTMGQIGAAYEGLAGNYANEQLDKFNQKRDAPLDAILKANAVFTGSGQLGSNTQQKVYQPTNWAQVGANGLGYALGGK